jgi:RNA polymerase sigma-70 factor (ECF subfamily)
MVREYTQISAEDLLQTCADLSNVDAWDEFLRRFHPVIVSALVRTARRYTVDCSHIIDDLEEEVYLKLCAKGAHALRKFMPRYPGSAFGYLRIVASCVAHDHFKRPKPNVVEDFQVDNLAEPDVMEWRLLVDDVDKILLRNATEFQRYIFWLYYLHGLTAVQIAALPGVNLSAKGVESLNRRLGRIVRKELQTGPRRKGKRKSPGDIVAEGSE